MLKKGAAFLEDDKFPYGEKSVYDISIYTFTNLNLDSIKNERKKN